MIGLRLLGMIDRRLRQAFPSAPRDAVFGGVSILLLGDFHQLPPVFDKPLYHSGEGGLSEMEAIGRAAYLSIDKTVRLEGIMRQQGPDQAAFRDALTAVRTMSCTRDMWDLLSTRCRFHASMTEEEIHSFQDAVRIYTTNAQVDDYNFRHMVRLQRPIVAIRATGSGTGWDKSPSKDAGGMELCLPVCVGARVMLTENACTPWGLVNGAMGIVHRILWKSGADSPHVILIHFDK